MKYQTQRRMASALSMLILISMVVSLVAPLGGQGAFAQETTAEPTAPTVAPATEEPTEAPETVAPTTEPTTETVVPTPDETEIPLTETVEPTATLPPVEGTPVVAPTGESTVVPPPETVVPGPQPTTNPDLWGDDFSDGDTVGWTLSPGWSLTADGTLATNGQFETAVITNLMWEHLSISANVGIQAGNTANIAFRVSGDNYNVTLTADGQASLYQGLTLLAQGPVVAVDPDATPDTALNWYAVTVTASGSQLSVMVDGVFQITHIVADPLPAGTVIFSSGVNNTGTVAIDDVLVQRLPAPAVIVTPEPTPVTPEPTPDTVEPTPETVEPIEVTPDAEVTPDVTVTVEPTPETTAVPTESTPETTETAPETTEVAPETTDPAPETTAIPTEPAPEMTVEPEVTDEVETTPQPETTIEPEVTVEPETTPDPEATPEVTPEPGVEGEGEETGPEPVIASDFEGDTSAWLFDAGASVLAGETNSAALLPPGGGLSPVETMYLADMQADFRVNLLDMTPVEGDSGPMGLLLRFHMNDDAAYLLAFSDVATTLYREAADGTLTELATVPAAHTLATWYDLSLLVADGVVTLDVNGVSELTFTDENAAAGGTFAFAASAAGSVLLDDVAVYDLSPGEVEPTMPPFSIDEVRDKMDGVLFGLLQAYSNGQSPQVEALISDYFIERDEAGNIGIVVWPAAGTSLDTLAQVVMGFGGVVDAVTNRNVVAYVPLDMMLELAADEQIVALTQIPRIASTGADASPAPAEAAAVTSGNIAPHTLDILGVNSWHEANARGAGVQIAVIDTGFNGINASLPDQACYAGSIGGTGTVPHGVSVVETLCDIAPGSQVYGYTANSGTEVVTQINAAAGAGRDLILVVADTGISGADIEGAITNARNAGVPVIASAGNTGAAGVKEFAYSTASPLPVEIETNPGSMIYYQAADSGNLYPAYMNGDTTDNVPGAGGFGSFEMTSARCDTTPCTVTLTVEAGAASNTTITVRVVDPSGYSSITGGTLPADGTLTEAAAADDAIAVGAVCFNPNEVTDTPEDRWLVWQGSARGNSGAGTPDVKPEVVAPTGIGTTLNPSFDSCEEGFNGTSASATHVAGLAALLLSNPNSSMNFYFNADTPARLEHYLMTRTIDLFPNRDSTGNADGYDNTFGSGLVQLGNPTFDLTFPWVRNWETPNNVSGNVFYVSTAALTASPNGTIGAPYNHPARAIEAARAAGGGTVVFMPGEYVTSFHVPATVDIVSYDSVDDIDYPNSSIWVNEMMDDATAIGGILITGATSGGARVQGFDFTGSSRLYGDYPGVNLGGLPKSVQDHLSHYLRPITVAESGSSNAADRIDINDNTFTNFDYPVQVITSNNVWIDDNRFTDFTNIAEAGTPLHAFSAVLDINESGLSSDANRIVVTNNTFENNTIGQDNDAGNEAESILGVRYAGVDLDANRFIGNSAAAIVFINQWPSGGPTGVSQDETSSDLGPGDEVVIFSSIFDGNTDLETLVHLYQGRNFRFTNNTVVNHVFDKTAFGDMITLGLSTSQVYEVCGGDNTCDDDNDHRVDIFNNLIYNNDMSGLIGVAAEQGDIFPGTSFECRAVDGTGVANYSGAANNWFAANTGSAGGICGDDESPDPADGTALVVTEMWDGQTLSQGTGFDPVRAAFEDAVFFTAANDPNDPYRLRPSDDLGNDPNPGIDAGDDSLVLGKIVTDTNPTNDPRAVDAQGDVRFLSLQPGTVGTLQNIDIGAYEAGEPEPIQLVSGRTTAFSADEDIRITVDLNQQVIEGFRPYSFTITEPPAFYDADPTSVCNGAPFSINEENVLTFCPASDYYTDGTPLELTFRAKGALLDDTVTGTVSLTLNEVNDGSPTDASSEQEVVYIDSLSSLDLRLRPYADFNAPGVDFSDAGDVDYPWTFGGFSIDSLTGEAFTTTQVNTAFGQVSANDNRLQLTPKPGEEGVLEFTYNVTDGTGNTTNDARSVRVVVVRQLATEGIYDDTDLNLFYSEGWNPFYFAPGYNSTLHYSSNSDQTFEMSFVGDVFVLDYREYPGAGDFEVALDITDDDTENFVNVLEPGATLGGIVCYGGNINNDGTTISAAADSARDAAFGCDLSGVSDDTPLTKLRVTTKDGIAFYLDAVEIRESVAVEVGAMVQQDTFGLSYSGTWGLWEQTGHYGGTAAFTNEANASMMFSVDTTGASELVIHHYMHPVHGDMQICRTGTLNCVTKSLTSEALSYRHAWVVPFNLLGLAANSVEQLTIRRVSGYVNIDAVQVRPAIELGEKYEQDHPAVTTDGQGWNTYFNALASGGSALFNTNSNQALSFTIDTAGAASLLLEYYTTPANGTAEVCVANTTTCQTRDYYGDSLTFGNLWNIPLSSLGITPGQTERITVRPVGGYINVDSIQLITATPALEAGPIYGHNSIAITQTGTWNVWDRAENYDGSALFTNVANSELSINVDTTGASAVVIYHYNNPVHETARVCGPSGQLNDCVETSFAGDMTFRNAWVIPFDELGLAANSVQTITFEHVSEYVNFDGIQLIGGPLTGGNFYDQDTDEIVKSGQWNTYVNPALEGGSAVFTNLDNTSLIFDIDTTGWQYLVLHTYTNPVHEFIEVCANDGVDCEQYSLNAPAMTFGNQIYIPATDLNLAADSVETITISRVSGYVNLDGISTANTLPQIALGGGFYNHDSPEFIYSGDWNVWANVEHYEGSAAFTNDPEASMKFTFDATGVTDVVIYHYIHPVHGTLEVCNGGTCATESFNNAELQYRQAWAIPADELNLPSSGTVTLDITHDGDYINIDGIALRSAMTNGNVYQDDSDVFTTVGEWGTWANASHAGGTALFTNDQTASLSFTLDTTNVSFILLHHYEHPVHGLVNICQTGTSDCVTPDFYAAELTFGQTTVIPVGDLNLPANDIARVTVTPQGDYINVDAIELVAALPPTPVMSAGNLYEENDPTIIYNGEWTTWNNPSTQGGTAIYSNDVVNGTATFTVNTTNMQNLILYHYTNNVQGEIEVCGNTSPCPTNNYFSEARTFGNTWTLSKAELGLQDNTEETITIKVVSGYVNISAIYIEAATPPELQPGNFYQENAPGITYAGGFNWESATNTEFFGGSLVYNNEPGASFTFDLESGSTGFILYVRRFNSATSINVCYDLKSGGGTPVCETVDANNPDLQNRYGFAFPGLPDDQAYTVEITHNGTVDEYLSFDGIAVLGSPQGILNGDNGRIDNPDPAFLYSPGVWTDFALDGYYGGSQAFARDAGAVVQFNIEGNAFSVIERIMSVGSSNVKMCVVDDGNIQPDRLRCTQFSQNSPTDVLQNPITFYGLGSGTHHIILIHEDHGNYIFFDAIDIHDN